MKTIIVPLDFSKESLTGLNLALMIAGKTGANIQMVHVVEINSRTSIYLQTIDYKQIEMKFEAILRKYKTKSKQKFEMSYIIKEGKVFKEVKKLAENLENAVIVLSTHGESGFEEWFIGGNAYKIASNSKIPVITVRNCKTASNFNKIVLPLDNSAETREKVPYTVKLAKLFNSEIHLLTVKESNSKSIENKLYYYAEQVASYIKEQKVPCKVKHLKGGNLTDLILEYSRSVNADLISIMTEQDMNASNLLLGSYAHQMINKANIPVLLSPTYKLGQTIEGFRTMG